MARNRVEVTINSRQYAILSDESDEYIAKLAEHIDEKTRLVIRGGQNVMGERPIVLAALNICDEYYKCEEAGRLMQSRLSALNGKLDAARAEIQRLRTATPQISFDEQEAEEKLRLANEKIKKLEDKLRRIENAGADSGGAAADNRSGYNKHGKRN